MNSGRSESRAFAFKHHGATGVPWPCLYPPEPNESCSCSAGSLGQPALHGSFSIQEHLSSRKTTPGHKSGPQPQESRAGDNKLRPQLPGSRSHAVPGHSGRANPAAHWRFVLELRRVHGSDSRTPQLPWRALQAVTAWCACSPTWPGAPTTLTLSPGTEQAPHPVTRSAFP